MTPVRTQRFRNRRTGRMEVWSAVSTDGVWTYVRLESPGTPWQVHHVPTDRSYLDRSLPRARRATDDGTALRYLDQFAAVPA